VKVSKTLVWLSILAAILAIVAAATGLFSQGGNGPFKFTTLHGDTAEIYGQGLYQYDTVLIAVGYKIGDGFMLLAAIPMLFVSLWQYQRGLVRGKILLGGIMMFLLYSYSSLAIGAAYNNMLLVYIFITTATFFGTLISVMSFEETIFPTLFSERLPRSGISIFLIVAGIAVFSLWFFVSMLPGLLSGRVPAELGSYTTVITFVMDMGIIAPAMIIVGLMFLQRKSLAYVLVPLLLVFLDVLGTSLLFMGIGQKLANLMNIGQFIGLVVSFAIMTFVSLGYTIAVFRNLSEPAHKP
jgi:hypothetical protein